MSRLSETLFWTRVIGAEGTVLDIITEVDAAAHRSQVAAHLEVQPHEITFDRIALES